MANFHKAIEKTLIHEGGGDTRYGISQRAYPDLDIENLTEEQAKNTYWVG